MIDQMMYEIGKFVNNGIRTMMGAEQMRAGQVPENRSVSRYNVSTGQPPTSPDMGVKFNVAGPTMARRTPSGTTSTVSHGIKFN